LPYFSIKVLHSFEKSLIILEKQNSEVHSSIEFSLYFILNLKLLRIVYVWIKSLILD